VKTMLMAVLFLVFLFSGPPGLLAAAAVILLGLTDGKEGQA
jgi:hypothetical protein